MIPDNIKVIIGIVIFLGVIGFLIYHGWFDRRSL